MLRSVVQQDQRAIVLDEHVFDGAEQGSHFHLVLCRLAIDPAEIQAVDDHDLGGRPLDFLVEGGRVFGAAEPGQLHSDE